MIDNISLYISFIAVADSGSISAAARSLFISQPALSAEIQQLESKLGTKLFFRTSRGMNMTEEGRLIYDYVSRALTFLSAGEEKLRDATGLRTGTLRIGASDMTLRFCLLDYIGIFRHRYPDVKLKITNAPTPSTIIALRSGEIDFGVISSVDNLAEAYEDLEFYEMRKIYDIFVCSPEYAVAAERGVPTERLNDFPIIALEHGTSTRRYVYSRLGDVLREPEIELATSDLVIEFARRGVGVASVVEDFAHDFIKSGELVKIDVAKPTPARGMYLAYLKKLPLSAAATRMIDIMKTEDRA